MNLAERLEKQINEINPNTIKTIAKGAKAAGKFAKVAGKKIGQVAGAAAKRNAGTAEAAVVAAMTAPLGQKVYDNIAKKAKLRKKAQEQVKKSVRNQIATRESLDNLTKRISNMTERLKK